MPVERTPRGHLFTVHHHADLQVPLQQGQLGIEVAEGVVDAAPVVRFEPPDDEVNVCEFSPERKNGLHLNRGLLNQPIPPGP